MLTYIKTQLYKLYVNLIIFADGQGQAMERLDSFKRALFFFAPLAFALELLGVWFEENQSFTLFVSGFILGNALVGGIAHFRKGDFKWSDLLLQTIKMTAIICLTYVTLEGLVSPLGDNPVTEVLIASFQLATLLYPGSKILKNIFIWSDGEHPPQWIMEKIYNFKENGDLKAFLGDREDNHEGGGRYEGRRYNRYKAEE